MFPTDSKLPGADLKNPYMFKHAIANFACPRYVMALQNENAGAGHRLREWAMGLWAATIFNLTFIHFPMLNSRKELKPEHGQYLGWDEIYGLRLGENQSSNYWNTRPMVREIMMPTFEYTKFTVPNEIGLAKWAHLWDANECGVIYTLPGNNWVYDISDVVRDIMAYKFLQASSRGHQWERPVMRADKVNIAVHFRRGDMVPTSEATLFKVVTNYALPALDREGLSGDAVEIHIFADGGSDADVSTFKVHNNTRLPRVHTHFDLDARESLWNMAHSDIFVGSRSSFSWTVALVSTQPYCLMQTGDKEHEFCPHGSGCCKEGECDESAQKGLAKTVARLANLKIGSGTCAGWETYALGKELEIEKQQEKGWLI